MILTAIVLLPLLAALIAILLPKEDRDLIRNYGVVAATGVFLLSLVLLWKFDIRQAGMQSRFLVDLPWVPALGIRFQMGVDGISVFLVLLTTFLTPIALLGAGGSVKDKHREFVACMLVLETGMLGAFVAMDMVLFYVFWEMMLVPMYLLIGIWGGDNRIYAAIKFVLYTMVGSVLMLVAILYLYFKFHSLTGTYSFSYAEWNRMILTPQEQLLCFGAFALSFAIKVPIFPLHTWLPDAHVEAPTPGSVILAGVLLKLGTYGLLRFAMPLFPYAATKLAPYLAVLGIIGILYGAFLAWAQGDAKKLIAYSSISHLGFVVLGLVALDVRATEGAIFIMLAHGITSGGLFLGFGMLYERRHTRLMNEYGGIWKVMPTFSALYLVILLGSVGLPGLCGFVGEFLVLLGAFDHSAAIAAQGLPVMLPHPKIMTAIAALGVIFGAVYLLSMFQKIFFGPVTNPKNETLQDVSGREIAALVPLIVLTFAMGLFPTPMLRRMEPSVKRYLAQYQVKHKASLDVAKGTTPRAVLLDPRVLADATLAPLPGKKRADVAPAPKRRGRSGVTAAVPGQRLPGQSGKLPVTRTGKPRPLGPGARPPAAPPAGGCEAPAAPGAPADPAAASPRGGGKP